MDPALLFPYPFREHQRELLLALHEGFSEGRHTVVESGTGTGKTACALTAALATAREHGLRVLYLTRTNSQAQQVILEYRRIRDKLGGDGTAVALQGRQHLCPLRETDGELERADAEELGVMCRDRMKSAEAALEGKYSKIKPCVFHLKGLQEGTDDLISWARSRAPEAEELASRVSAAGRCPFVVSRALLPEAEVVVAPYIYFLHPALRMQLYRMMAVAPEELLVIVDEAHNLAPAARELATARLTRHALARAETETQSLGDPTVLRDLPISQFMREVGRVLESLRHDYLSDHGEDALLPPDEFDVALLTALRTSTPALDRALVIMGEYAAAAREARRREGKRPRSDVGNVVAFLQAYRNIDPETHAPIIEAEGEDVRLVLHALDPSVLTSALNDVAASAHVSGTLQPLEEHRDTNGLPRERTALARFASPFPPENRLVVVDDEVTTRHEDVTRDPEMWSRIGERIRDVRASTDRNMAVFLPSYDALHRLAPFVRGSHAFVEVRGARQAEIMAQVAAFKATRGGTLLSVIGGRMAEGLDFPDDQLEVVVVVGLPYAKPSAKLEALVRFYDRKFERGWAWAVQVPMSRKVVQAAGRLIRTPEDRGVVVLMDRRAAVLRDVLPESLRSSDPARDVREFFGNQRYRGVAHCGD